MRNKKKQEVHYTAVPKKFIVSPLSSLNAASVAPENLIGVFEVLESILWKQLGLYTCTALMLTSCLAKYLVRRSNRFRTFDYLGYVQLQVLQIIFRRFSRTEWDTTFRVTIVWFRELKARWVEHQPSVVPLWSHHHQQAGRMLDELAESSWKEARKSWSTTGTKKKIWRAS